jgi:hypothetical protein
MSVRDTQNDNSQTKSLGGGLPSTTANDMNASKEIHSIKENSELDTNTDDSPPRNFRFWLVFISLCLTSLSTSLGATVIATALPTIVNEIGGKGHYVWIGNSFLLTSTIIQPLVGQLADIFNRKTPMLFSLTLFMLGTGLAGGASNVGMLIAARTI